MSKAKTNALDSLRALIAERQQYEGWITALEAKREGTPEHVFERVQSDYQNRLQRVITDIRGHSEELQLNISTLSGRLVEVAREEDTRREGLQEAELRAAVGEYEPEQWEQLRTEAEEAIEKIAADRASLDNQLSELRSIQKLSEAGSVGTPSGSQPAVAVESERSEPVAEPTPSAASPGSRDEGRAAAQAAETASDAGSSSQSAGHRSGTAAAPQSTPAPSAPAETKAPQPEQPRSAEPVAAAASATAGTSTRPRTPTGRTPPGGVSAGRSKSEAARPDQAKTLKCPECGTPNYPTEWYCERCGGELATM